MKKRIKIKKTNEKGKKELLWIWLAIISMSIYILWRLFFTIPDFRVYGWVATICGCFLFISEAVSMLEGTEHFASLRKKVVPDKPEIPQEWYPHVDVLIATHNEETELLYKTVNGCKHMIYPDRKKVHIYLCDDGNRPEVAQLAAEMEVGYFPLTDNKHAKAGNLNNALSQINSPYVATFDADMIPTRHFLMETVPYMFLPKMKQLEDGTWVEREKEELDEEYKIGFIQTPQSFYNPDLFQYNFFSEQRIPNEQDFFFREVNVGRNRANAPIYAGSNTLINRAALDEVGGIATGTITEDFETGINIQAKGYTCYAIDKAVAHGIAPTDIDNLIKQRVRWGRGCVSSLRRVNILLHPELSLNAKISYISCWMYWWTFFRRFVFIFSPIIFVLLNIPVVICSLPELLFIWLPSYLCYNHALKVTSGKIRNQRWSNIVDTVIFPYMIIPILLETLMIREKKFHVTQKTRSTEKKSDMQLAIPQVLLLATDLIALYIAVSGAIKTGNVGAVIIIFWLLVNGLNLIMSIFFMAGRQNFRVNDRFFVEIPVELNYKGKKYYGVTGDVSETGLSVLLNQAEYIPHSDNRVELRLKTDVYEAFLTGKSMHVSRKGEQWKYGIALDPPENQNKNAYFQLLYDRNHSLANKMGKSVSIFEDIYLNIHRRTEKMESSKRALPRIELNLVCRLKGGGRVRLLNSNYEYVLLEKVEGALEDRLTIVIPKGSMECVATGDKPGLYYVENWEELLFGGQYEALFTSAKWEKKKS